MGSLGWVHGEEQIQKNGIASIARESCNQEVMAEEEGGGIEGKAEAVFSVWSTGTQQTDMSNVGHQICRMAVAVLFRMKESDKTRHRKPRSFEHRWKLRAAKKRNDAEKG